MKPTSNLTKLSFNLMKMGFNFMKPIFNHMNETIFHMKSAIELALVDCFLCIAWVYYGHFAITPDNGE